MKILTLMSLAILLTACAGHDRREDRREDRRSELQQPHSSGQPGLAAVIPVAAPAA